MKRRMILWMGAVVCGGWMQTWAASAAAGPVDGGAGRGNGVANEAADGVTIMAAGGETAGVAGGETAGVVHKVIVK